MQLTEQLKSLVGERGIPCVKRGLFSVISSRFVHGFDYIVLNRVEHDPSHDYVLDRIMYGMIAAVVLLIVGALI